MPTEATLAHLAALYAADPDPWGHLTRPYERRKHRETVAAAGPGPFAEAVEIGCGNGALAVGLAPLCRRLTALEAIPAALAGARPRLAPHPHVTLIHGRAPHDLPDLRPDLVVLSEVLYFLTPGDVDALAAWIASRITPRGRVVAANWTGPTGEALSGRDAADRLRAGLAGWRGLRAEREGYLLDVLTPDA